MKIPGNTYRVPLTAAALAILLAACGSGNGNDGTHAAAGARTAQARRVNVLAL